MGQDTKQIRHAITQFPEPRRGTTCNSGVRGYANLKRYDKSPDCRTRLNPACESQSERKVANRPRPSAALRDGTRNQPLIRSLRAAGVPDAGLKAKQALVDAEISPELTFASFKKLHLRRDYSARVKGIDVFLMWAKTVGIEVDTENLVLWCRKHPFILHRFYEAAAAAGIRIKNCARVWGLRGVFRHVFCGFKLVIERASGTTGSGTTSTNTSGNMSGPAGDDTNDACELPTKPVFSGALRRSG